MDTFLRDLENGVHAAELIAEIFKENEVLPDYNIAPIVRKFIQYADDQPLESTTKTTLLSFLPVFLRFGNLVLKENQILVLNELTSSSRKNTNHVFSGSEKI